MGHYALLDSNMVVVQVITGKHEGEDGVDWETFYGEFHGMMCKRTSYNTHGGVHSADGAPFRKNYAGIGFQYDPVLDAFIPPQPGNNYELNVDTGLWVHLPEIGIVGNSSPIITADGEDAVTIYLYSTPGATEEVTLNGEALQVAIDSNGYGEFELSTSTPGLIVVGWGGFSLEVAAL